MRSVQRFLLALAVAMILMLAFRALAFTIYTVPGSRLSPVFLPGDRVMVNRWSYGLRTGGEGSLFHYGRLFRQQVGRGHLVAVDDSLGGVQICRCVGVPGDTVKVKGRTCIVPGLYNCARRDYYWMESIRGDEAGFVAEEAVIGRAFLIVYNHDDRLPLWRGYDGQRCFLLP